MTKDGDDQTDDNEPVGYCSPPREHQIKTGEIRNRWGRKGKPRPKVDFLDEPFELRIDGRSITTTRRLALDHALFNAAMTKGRVSSVKELERRSREREADGKTTGETASQEEQAALDRYLHRRLKELQVNENVDEARRRRKAPQGAIDGLSRNVADRKFVPGCKK